MFSHLLPVKLGQLKVKQREVDRERIRSQQVLRKLEARQESVIDSVKNARRADNKFDVDYHWDELKSVRADIVITRRDVRRTNLESITLKKFVTGLEKLNRQKDKKSTRRLFEKIRNSSLDAKLMDHDIKEQDYLDELAIILESVGLDPEADVTDDPEKDRFLEQLDVVIMAEDSGKVADTTEIDRLLEDVTSEPSIKHVDSPERAE